MERRSPRPGLRSGAWAFIMYGRRSGPSHPARSLVGIGLYFVESMTQKDDIHAELQAVNVMVELEKMGWQFQPTSEDEIKCKCPAHDDKSPSCGINIRKKVWKCMSAGCGASGDFITFMAIALKSTRRTIVAYIQKEYKVESGTTIDTTVVEQYHEKIWDHAILKKELYERGLDDEDIRKWRLGVDENHRITIPIWNDHGSVVNIRRYKPGAPGKDKMRNMRGCGKNRLHPVSQLAYDKIILVGGEVKAYAVARRMNQFGYGAVTTTGGEDNWESDFTPRFKGKQVWICYDIDDGGHQGTDKVAARLKGSTVFVKDVTRELTKVMSREVYPHGDVNDYFGQESKTAQDFKALVEQASDWMQPTLADELPRESGEVADVHLADSTRAEYARRRVRTKAVITAMDTTPYVIPKLVGVECDKNQPFCVNCPIYAKDPGEDGVVQVTISAESPAILDLVNAGKKTKNSSIREGLGIPPCKSCSFHVKSHYNVEDVRISPQLEISSRHSDSVMIPALTVSHGLEMNLPYQLVGRLYPHPRSQQAVLLISSATPAEDALNTYKPSEDELRSLEVFQPDEWTTEALEAQLVDLYEDLSANITRIYDRRDLHLFVDLAYHSPLLINFDGRREKGWTEILVVGDSAQGKSEATKRMMEHYRLGEKIEVKNASTAGLLGGLQQLGSRWMVTWGVIPRHDRRLVVLEELKGASTEMIGKLTDMRSSGVAEIDKIEKRRTHARTRLLALSNPRSDQPLASYSYGVEAVRELIGSPEDLRRFDAVLVVSAGEVAASRLNALTSERPVIPHTFTSDLCQRCILWAWTRSEDQVTFEQQAIERVLEGANTLCAKYVDAIPILDRGSARYKLARLSASLACRTASFGDTCQTVLVRSCHVDYIVGLLDRVYSSAGCGYSRFSETYLKTRKIQEPKKVWAKVIQTPFPADFIDSLMHTDEIELRDLCDWTGWDRPEATELLSFLVRKHALIRDGRGYRKNPDFIQLIRDMRDSEDMKLVTRPDFLQEVKNEF